MLFNALLVVATVLLSVSAQTTKVPPPSRPGLSPAFWIYQDVDQVAWPPNGNQTACSGVKSQRSTCYALGVAQKSFFAEQKCLCDPKTAYLVTQCFAYNYGAINNSTQRDQYYTSFLNYAYDCYCGVEQVDPTYNATVNPPAPYITGFTGAAILPPAAGCPAKPTTPPDNCTPKPPCGCPPPPPPAPAPCPTGYSRCNGACVPNCPVPKPCGYPKVYDNSGNCVCPSGTTPVGADSCEIPNCPANEEYVLGPRGGGCQCIDGYEPIKNYGCFPICPAGSSRKPPTDPNAPCTPDCTAPLVLDWNNNCVCPWAEGYEIINGQCTKRVCTPPLLIDPYYPGCYCPDPAYYNNAGACVYPRCYDTWNPACYPDSPIVYDNATISIVSEAPPPFSSYSSMLPLESQIASAQDSIAASVSASASASASEGPAPPAPASSEASLPPVVTPSASSEAPPTPPQPSSSIDTPQAPSSSPETPPTPSPSDPNPPTEPSQATPEPNSPPSSPTPSPESQPNSPDPSPQQPNTPDTPTPPAEASPSAARKRNVRWVREQKEKNW